MGPDRGSDLLRPGQREAMLTLLTQKYAARATEQTPIIVTASPASRASYVAQLNVSPPHSMPCTTFRDCRIKARTCLRSSIAAFVYRPCLSAF
jgi:hypothetical protein